MTKPLPDSTRWVPENVASINLRDAFAKTCRLCENKIRMQVQAERGYNVYNYDSGPGVEDLVRNELKVLLPRRYGITSGVVVASNGNTCGECDIVIINDTWFPLLKYGATTESRRVYVPVEAIYSVIEVKQTLTEASLDDAMEKIVKYKRLTRSTVGFGQIVENHAIPQFDDPRKSLNRRFDVILGGGCPDDNVADLVKRFFRTNETLPLEQRVNGLAILGSGYACYISRKPQGGTEDLLYPETSKWAPLPCFWRTSTDSFLFMFSYLWTHLASSVLKVADFVPYLWTGVEHQREIVSLES